MNLFEEQAAQTKETPAQTQTQQRRKTIYTVLEREGMEKGLWVKIGIGFVNRDGSINVYLNALPINGQLNIRDYDPEREGRHNNAERR